MFTSLWLGSQETDDDGASISISPFKDPHLMIQLPPAGPTSQRSHHLSGPSEAGEEVGYQAFNTWACELYAQYTLEQKGR